MKSLHKLKQLSVSKVSLVPKGSNPQADVVFYKQDASVERATFNEIMDAEMARASLYQVYNACYTMQDAIASSLHGDGDMRAEVRESIDQFKAYVSDLLEDIGKKKTKKEDLNIDSIATTLVERHNKFLVQFAPAKETAMKKAFKDMTAEEQAAHVVELERQLAEKTPAPADPPAPAVPTIPEEVQRALPEEVQAVLRANAAQVAALAAANEANTAVVRQLQDESETRRFIEIARAEIPNLPGTDAEKATMLRGLKSLPGDAYEKQMAILKASNEAMRRVALSEIGSSAGAAPAADTAAGQLNALAREIQKANAELTHAQSYERACSQRTDLYREMREERFATHRA